jgi:RNA polymerase sigma-54 factor
MLKLGQVLVQTQIQILKPQQILVSSLLQLPMLLLEQKIQMELQINPVLEEMEEWEDTQDDEEEIDEDEMETEQIQDEFEILRENNKSEEDKRNDEIQEEVNLEELLPNDDEDLPEPRLPVDRREEKFDSPVPYQTTMSEHLLNQLHLLNLQEIEFRIGEYIIYSLRDDGYLDVEVKVEQIALIFGTSPEKIEHVLKVIQKLNPPGIAARNLRECLIIQLESKNEKGKYAVPLLVLKECYDDFINRRFEKVVAELNILADDVKNALIEIRKLNPKPGRGYSNVKQNYIIPDFHVENVDNELVISLNVYKTPGLRISHHYKKMIRQPKNLNHESRKFLKEKVNSAKWFIKAIQQRQVTMQRTMEAIVDKQRDFFEKGPEYIQPMIMRDIAEEIDMDISTISRVCKGKYVDTDFGLFELKYFFNEGMETDDGEILSTLRIKENLKEIIATENSRKPYSDEKLAQILNEESIPIARRTVAKYREFFGIPVARLRRNI